jgi:hypothetical protein
MNSSIQLPRAPTRRGEEVDDVALTSADLMERGLPIHSVAFVRDNMFRALAWFEPDFSRHVEGSVLRLRWDESALLHLVASRLRVVLATDIENDIKVWNRFAHRGLENRSGFERCLHSTLYRPRDLIVLLNKAHLEARKAGRSVLIEDDVEAAARQISLDRLDDLFKEYDVVLPGLRLFAELFRGSGATATYADILTRLRLAQTAETFDQSASGDFEALGTPTEIFMALYGVGLLGVRKDTSSPFVFCHDGARSDLESIAATTEIAFHPCYWRALDIGDGRGTIEVATQAYDEYEPVRSRDVRDLRVLRLGQAVEELPKLATGDTDASAFEDWVLRAVKILFAGSLSNVALHDNGNAVQRRDVIATNSAPKGFWRRIFEDYGSRQIVFEIKNYAELGLDDIRQALSYSGKEYGKFVTIVYRSPNEGADERERAWLQEMYSQHSLIVLLLPAIFLQRFLSKYRSKPRQEYWEKAMAKRLDTHLRNYVNVKSGRRHSKLPAQK